MKDFPVSGGFFLPSVNIRKRASASREGARGGGAGGLLPYKRLMGMCRWMGSHFYDWIDYNGVAFLIELLEWGRTSSGFLG